MRAFVDRAVQGHEEKWQEAVKLFRQGDRAGALFRFKRLANEGCGPALVEIANIYEQGGAGVAVNTSMAERYYELAVDVLDDPKAHLALGRINLQKTGSEDCLQKARYHFQLLENDFEMGAFYGLGLMYELGLGVDIDLDKAISYYSSASDLGHVIAQRNIGRIFLKKKSFSGLAIFLNASLKMIKIAAKNPADKRLNLH